MAGPTDATRAERAEARPVLLAELECAGTLPCPRCGHPMHPWQDLDVGHTHDVATHGHGPHNPTRLEHMRCNRGAAGREWVPPPDRNMHSREW